MTERSIAPSWEDVANRYARWVENLEREVGQQGRAIERLKTALADEREKSSALATSALALCEIVERCRSDPLVRWSEIEERLAAARDAAAKTRTGESNG